MSLSIIKAGLLDTIQDAGRHGYQHLGINPGGAMDRFAAAMAGALLGNEKNAPVLELHFPASAVLFTKPALIALTGADFGAALDGVPIPLYQPVLVNENTTLHFTQRKSGARAYLAVQGGFINIDQWLGSYSTHLKLKAGGYKGRALKKKDVLETNALPAGIQLSTSFRVLSWSASSFLNTREEPLMILPGPEWNGLDKKEQQRLLQQDFQIGKQSDRMGYQLEGKPLQSIRQEELISSPVTFGTIQLLPDGKLIVLMADHQTTGGYPRIATVISAHHSRLAQKQVGDTVHFSLTDQQTAEDLFIQQQRHLQQVRRACWFKLEGLTRRE